MAYAFIGTVNHADGAASIVASTAVSNLPTTNLIDDQTAKVWRSTGSTVSLTLTYSGLRYLDGVALINTNLTTVGTIRVRVSTDSATMATGVVYDSGVKPVKVDPRFRIVTHIMPSIVRGLYVLIDLVDTSQAYVEAGRLWTGQVWRFARKHVAGHKDGYPDLTKQDVSESGHVWLYKYPSPRRFSITLPAVTEHEYQNDGTDLAINVGMHAATLLCLDSADSQIAFKTLWGIALQNIEYASKAARGTAANADEEAYYTTSFLFVEQR